MILTKVERFSAHRFRAVTQVGWLRRGVTRFARLQEVENPVGQVSLLGIEKRTNLKPSSLNIIGNEDTQWHDVVR